MTFLVVLGIYFAVLYFMASISKRLSAMASLALCAGAVIAKLWTNELTPLVASAGVQIIAPPLGSIVAITLTLLPAFLVLLKSPKVAHRRRNFLSSLLFALLAVTLTYGAFSNAVVLDEQSKQIVLQMVQYEKWILTGCITAAICEIVLFHRPHHPEAKKER